MAQREVRMEFVLNERKAAQAAAVLLKAHGKPMSQAVLIKLLYMADRRSLIETGYPITGDRMVAMEHGPVLSGVYDATKSSNTSSFRRVWLEYVTEPDVNEVALRGPDPDADELSPYEVRLLNAVHAQCGHMSFWGLRNYTHTPTFAEWQDPGKSSRLIDPATILRNEGWEESAIQAAALEAAEDAEFDRLLAKAR